MTTPVNFRVKNGLTVANGVAVTQGNVTISNGSLVIGATAINATSISGAADNAYANGVNYTNGKAADAYGNAVAVATGSSTNAYSNAVAFAANATNLTTGTLPLARLPATVNISSALNVTNTVNISTSNVTVSQGNDVAMMTGTVISLTDSLSETSNTYYAAVSHEKLITSKNYSIANVIYADYGEISRAGMFAVAGLDTTNSSIYVKGVTVNTSIIVIGNTTVYSSINSTAMVGNGALVTSVNAATVGGNSAIDLRTYAETYASNATNLTSGTVNAARLPAANSTVAGAVVLVNSTSNTSTTAAASASSVKTAFDAAGSAYTNAVSYTDTKIGTANTAMVANAAAAYTNAIAIAANATNLTSGTVNIARIPTVDAVNNTSVSFVATANSVKTAYDAAITANTNAASALANAATAYTNAIAIAANATNLTSGTVNSARLPSGNSSVAGAVVLVDSVSNTSTTAAASAASVKTAYDAAITANTNAQAASNSAASAYTNAVSYTDTKIGTANTAMVANAAAAYTNAVSYVDGKINTANAAITGNAATAYTNAVSYTDGKILTANGAITGNAATAYTNSVSYTDTKIGTANTAMVANASAAYTNAIIFAANASNANNGTLAFARLPTVDSVANTSVALVPTANNVKTAYDAAITANTNAQTALTAAGANSATAYTNAVSYTDTKIGTANTAMAANAATAYTNAVSYTDTKIGTANTAMVANAAAAYTNATVFAANASNANNGTLAEARLPFRMNQNVRTTDNVTFANGSFSGSLSIGGDLTVTGNITSVNVSTLSVADSLIKLAVNNNADTLWGGFIVHYEGSGNTTNHAGLARNPTSKEFVLISTFGNEPNVDSNIINISDPSFTFANLQVNLLKSGNSTVFSTINSTAFSGTANNATNAFGKTEGAINANSALTANNSTNLGGQAAAFYTNATNITTGTLPYAQIPANIINTTAAFTISGVHTYSANVILGSSGLSANGGFGTATHVLHSNGTATYWAVDDNTTYDLTAVANTAVNAGLLRLADVNNSNDTVTFTGTGTSTVSSNATHVIINSADQFSGTVTSVVAANGLNGGTITSTGTLSILGGSTLTVNTTGAHVNSALSIDRLLTSNNGSGTNISIGDDAWFGDVNIADTVRIMGQQSANNGYIIFGNADNSVKLGRAGTGALTWNGAFSVTGGLTTLSANLVMANNNITRPILTGYTEHEVANTAATGSYSLDCGAANFWDLTLTGNITIAPTNIPPSTRMWAGTIAAKQDATGGRTITWPTGSKYPGGVAPPATTTANALDIWSLMTYDGGTSWIVSLTVKGAA